MPGVTTSTVLNTDSTLKAREIDFVTRFEKNWDALRTILGIVIPIRKEPGTSLVTYEAQMKDERQSLLRSLKLWKVREKILS